MFCRKRPCFYLLCTMKAAPGMARPGRFYPPRLPAPTTPAALRYRASGEGNQPPPGSPPGKCLSGHPFPSSTAHRQSQNVVRHAARQGFPPTPLRAAGPRLDGARAGRLINGADGRLRRGRESRRFAIAVQKADGDDESPNTTGAGSRHASRPPREVAPPVSRSPRRTWLPFCPRRTPV